MKRSILCIVLFGWVLPLFADGGICSGGTLNNLGTVAAELCSGGQIHQSVETMSEDNFTFSQTPVGNWGNTFSSSFGNDAWIPVGFLGTQRTHTSLQNITPVGFFGQYTGVDISYPEQSIENNFSLYPLVKPLEEDENTYSSGALSGGGVAGGACSISAPHGVYAQIGSNGFLDYIEISWQKTENTSYKVVRIFPEYKVFEIEDGKNFYDMSIQISGEYQYFVVAYNDCSPGVYSDMIRIDYERKIRQSQSYFSLVDNTITLHIPQNIIAHPNTQYALLCNSGAGEFHGFLDIEKKYRLPDEMFGSYFSCYAEFFDDANRLIQSQKIYFNPSVSKILKNQDILEILTGKNDSSAYRDVPFLYNLLGPSTVATQASVSTFISNITLGVFIEDPLLAHTLFVDIGLSRDIAAQDIMTYDDFIDMYTYILLHKSDIQKKLIERIDTYFSPEIQDIYTKLLAGYIVQQKLSDLRTSDRGLYQVLLACYTLEKCYDIEAYSVLQKKIQTQVEQYSTQLYDDNQHQVNTPTTIQAFYKVLGYEEFLDTKHSLYEYDIFSEALRVAQFPEMKDEKLEYFYFYTLYLHTIQGSETIALDVQYLLKGYFENIISLYRSSKKEKLFDILRTYVFSRDIDE